MTNPVGDSMTIVVAGMNSNARSIPDESDDVEDAKSEDVEAGTNSNFWEEDSSSRCGSEGPDSKEFKDEGCHPGFWNDDDDDNLDKNSEDEVSDQGPSKFPVFCLLPAASTTERRMIIGHKDVSKA